MFLEKEVIRLLFRLSLIEKYIETLSEYNLKILYDEDKFENPLKIKFPNITSGGYGETLDEIIDKMYEIEEMEIFENDPLTTKNIIVLLKNWKKE